MKSPWIEGLRSVALDVPDLVRAEDFYTRTWHLEAVARSASAIHLRGTSTDHHLLSLHVAPADRPAAIRHVTLRARSNDALTAIVGATRAAGGEVLVDDGDDPAGGTALLLRDPDGRLLRVVHGDVGHAGADVRRDRPVRLAHVVLNSHDVDASQRFFEQALGFRLVDRTRVMAFMNCNEDHHSIALGDADNDALNHIAFLMPDVESVMRGGGRLRDADHAIEWGPGRHGPGNNAFSYFIDPFGVVIEYTAEVQQIDASYRTGGPDDWKWPAGRIDQWGISAPPTARLKAAQRAIFFKPAPSASTF